jgi:hypothetical protein
MCCTIHVRRIHAAKVALIVWYPGEFELALFCIYSPAHAVLWMAITQSNWIWMLDVMGMVWVQVGRY